MAKEEDTIMPAGFTINSDKRLDQFKHDLDEMYEKHSYVLVEYYTRPPRTLKQNNALHSFCNDIANKCNNAGYWYEVTSPVLKSKVELPWTKENVKSHMWKPVQTALFPGTKSSRDLSTKELSEVAQSLSTWLQDKHQIRAYFPKEGI
tara:strand:+ start:44 stop:487 length:444 start_codon:yes stop_codon:yes gene_type:complete